MDKNRLQVLLVEDDYLDAFVTKRYLEKSLNQYDIHHLTSGLEAVDFLLKRKKHRNAVTPDFILLDLRLPGMTGNEIIEFMNAHSELRKIPVIVISAEPRSIPLSQASSEKDVYPVFVKWLGMKDFKSIVKAAEDLITHQQHQHSPAV